MSQDKPRWALRAPTSEDLPFVFNSFLKSYRDSTAVSGVPNTLYYREMHTIIERMLARAHIVIGCDPGEPGLIFGWAAGEVATDGALTFHYVYVKHAFRNFGLGGSLEAELKKLPHEGVRYSCRTSVTGQLLKKRADYTFDPFSLWSK